jgi:hypothetical protein
MERNHFHQHCFMAFLLFILCLIFTILISMKRDRKFFIFVFSVRLRTSSGTKQAPDALDPLQAPQEIEVSSSSRCDSFQRTTRKPRLHHTARASLMLFILGLNSRLNCFAAIMRAPQQATLARPAPRLPLHLAHVQSSSIQPNERDIRTRQRRCSSCRFCGPI